jgi:hypothetical protein
MTLVRHFPGAEKMNVKQLPGYLLAFLVGLPPAFFIVFNAVFSDSSGAVGERLVTYLLTVGAYGLLGLLFGFLAPAASWRWGVALAAAAVLWMIVYSFREPGIVLLNLSYAIVSLLSASLAAKGGALLARARRKG